MADDPDGAEGLPEQVRDWLSGVAEERELSEGDLLDELVGAGGAGDPQSIESRLGELEAAVDALDGELDRKIADVRDRVIQVKREADAKAPADHDHEQFDAELERLGGKIGALGRDFVDLTASVDDLDERVETVDGRLEAGFSNFEEVLEYLMEATDDLQGKLSTLARATRDLRTRVDRLAAAAARRSAADQLRTTASEHGVTVADCEACGETVHLGLLAAPECPHCAARFTELEPRRGFFRTSLLHTGERPALEGGVDREAPDLAPLVAESETATPEIGSVTDPGEGPAAGSGEATGDDTADVEPTNLGADGAPVDVVEGVGPTFAERLRAAGVESVTDLALADPDRLAEETDIARGRVETLVSRARSRADLE